MTQNQYDEFYLTLNHTWLTAKLELCADMAEVMIFNSHLKSKYDPIIAWLGGSECFLFAYNSIFNGPSSGDWMTHPNNDPDVLGAFDACTVPSAPPSWYTNEIQSPRLSIGNADFMFSYIF